MMRRICRVCKLLLLLVLAAAGCGRGEQAAEREAEPAPDVRVPEGFRAAAGTTGEAYSDTGWAGEIIHITTGIEMVFIPAGEFGMGAALESRDWREDQSPVHRVRLTRPFYLAKYEVTQAQWRKVMRTNPSTFKGEGNPVEHISWDDCRQFLQKAGDGLRLPTEAEWEYACRAGTSTEWSCGNDERTLGDFAWYNYNSGETTHPVGRKKPNARGLHDMHGNVWEWCADWYHGGYYADSPAEDPPGPASGKHRVIRGGAYYTGAGFCRSGNRNRLPPMYAPAIETGFRPARDVE